MQIRISQLKRLKRFHKIAKVLTGFVSKMTESSLKNVAEDGGQLPPLHLSGHLTPDTAETEAGAQAVVAQRTLNTHKKEKQNRNLRNQASKSHRDKDMSSSQKT